MRKVLKIDVQGYFIEDVLIENEGSVPSDCVDTVCQEGFYKPKWNGTEWVEGLTLGEIDTIVTTPHPKTELEILKETVDMLVLSSLGV